MRQRVRSEHPPPREVVGGAGPGCAPSAPAEREWRTSRSLQLRRVLRAEVKWHFRTDGRPAAREFSETLRRNRALYPVRSGRERLQTTVPGLWLSDLEWIDLCHLVAPVSDGDRGDELLAARGRRHVPRTNRRKEGLLFQSVPCSGACPAPNWRSRPLASKPPMTLTSSDLQQCSRLRKKAGEREQDPLDRAHLRRRPECVREGLFNDVRSEICALGGGVLRLVV